MVRNVVVLSLAMVMAGPVMAAQTRPAAARSAAEDAPTRIAVINIQNAIAATDQGKQRVQELRAKFAPRQTDIQNISKQMQDIQDKVQAGQNTLSDAEKSRLEFQYQQLSRNLQREQQEYQEDAQDAQTDVVDSIGQNMMPLITKYASENHFSVVLDTSTQSNPVLFASNTVDITNTIVSLYNEQFPVKTAAAPAAKPK
jgi:outer membrane protein